MRSRAFPILAGSIVIGSVSGASAVLDIPFAAGMGFVIGSVFGLVLAPIPMMALARKELAPSLLVVGVTTMGTAVFATSMHAPPLAWLATTIVFVVTCLVVRDWLPDSVEPGHCRSCGYDLAGLVSVVCPECGKKLQSSPNRKPRRRTLVALLLGSVLIGVFGGVAWIVHGRRTPTTTAALIERLGANDMDLSWNAQQALMKQGKEPLLTALSHTDPSVRGKAAQALGWMKDPSVIPDLERLRTDRDPWVKRMVEIAIDQLDAARANEGG